MNPVVIALLVGAGFLAVVFLMRRGLRGVPSLERFYADMQRAYADQKPIAYVDSAGWLTFNRTQHPANYLAYINELVGILEAQPGGLADLPMSQFAQFAHQLALRMTIADRAAILAAIAVLCFELEELQRLTGSLPSDVT